jgi:hypothetical protein
MVSTVIHLVSNKSVLDKIMDTVITVVATIAALIATIHAIGLSQMGHIKKNWPKYRCNPIYMPLADDVFGNFTRCTMKGFQDYAGYMMDPIMAEFTVVNEVITDIGGAMDDMRGMMGSVRGGFMGIVGSVFGKIQNVMSSIQYIIIRMRTLLARIMGVMMSFMLIFTTGAQTVQSVANGPIMKVMSAL